MSSNLASEPLPDAPRRVHLVRTTGDRIFRLLAGSAGLVTFVVLFLIGFFLCLRAVPALRTAGLGFLTHTQWATDGAHPDFGIAALLYWTAVISLVALVVAVPSSIAISLFLTEYSPRRIRRFLTSLVDLLAAIPSLIYGLWGFFFLQPHVIGLSRWLTDHLGFIPLFRTSQDIFASSAFIAGLVVALMVLPICTSVIREVFSQTPPAEKEAALALGGTRLGMIRTVVLPFGRGGIVGGSMLGLGRALGETIAVAIIISPTFSINPHILQSGANSIAAHIALRFVDATPTNLSALMGAGLALFVVTLLVNSVASMVVARSRAGAGVEI